MHKVEIPQSVVDRVVARRGTAHPHENLDPERTAWSVENSVENGDIEKDKKPSAEQVANFALAREAVEAAGGPVVIGNCKV